MSVLTGFSICIRGERTLKIILLPYLAIIDLNVGSLAVIDTSKSGDGVVELVLLSASTIDKSVDFQEEVKVENVSAEMSSFWRDGKMIGETLPTL